MGSINPIVLNNLFLKVQKPTRYSGHEFNAIKKDWNEVLLKVGLIFPDIYEVGMSHLGLKILYHLLNGRRDILAERIYAPWPDMEEELKRRGIPLFSLESKREVGDFHILGFTLQYELSYTNLLNILQLAKIPLYGEDRDDSFPLVIAGGPNAFNPEPLAPFIDVFVIGEGEEVILELVDLYMKGKREGLGKEDLLGELGKIPGLYVPSIYRMEDHGLSPPKIQKRVVKDLDKAFYPQSFIVPYMEIIHDRVILELARGCSRGCRFCQAGILYRPVRERSPERLRELARSLLKGTGYGEISLASLSSSDYSHIQELSTSLVDEFSPLGVGISLPSLRLDSFSICLANQVQRVRKTGLTFAPEAGTSRLRQVINKGIKEDDLMKSVESAFSLGWKSLKLYFMIGLPTEEEKDVEAIAQLAQRAYSLGKREAKGGIRITVSVSNFVPKPHTPFQWVSFLSQDKLKKRINFLKGKIHALKGNIPFNWHDPRMSLLEAVLARGDRRLAPVLVKAQREGARFDGWSEHFHFPRWKEAFSAHGLVMEDFIGERSLTGKLPWAHIDTGVQEDFLLKEYRRAMEGELTLDCRHHACQSCGIQKNFNFFLCGGGGR